MIIDEGFLQHGKAGEPMRTEKVTIKNEFGSVWLAHYEGRWRKVHMQVKRTFIVYCGERITIKIWGV